MSCTLCDLHKNVRSILIPFRGQYRKPKLLIVSAAPGPQDDQSGVCFQGPQAELMLEVFRELNIPDDCIAYDNVVKCWPRDATGMSRDPSSEEILHCSAYLWRTIKLVDPDVIVTLGTLAWQAVTGLKTYVSDVHGKVEQVSIAGKDRKVVCTFHPFAALRQGKARGPGRRMTDIIDDIRYAWEHALGYYYLPEWECINSTEGIIQYIENQVRLYREGQIDFGALDTETPQMILNNDDKRLLGLEMVSKDLWDPERKIVGFSLSYFPPELKALTKSGVKWLQDVPRLSKEFRKIKGVYTPLWHPESQVDYNLVGHVVKWAYDREGEVRLPLAFHNHKYDAQWLMEKFNTNPINYHDTMLGSFIYHGTSIKHGLGNVSHKIARVDIFKDDTDELLMTLPIEKRSFYHLPLKNISRRGAVDAAVTVALTVLEQEMLEESQQTEITAILNEGSEAFAEMEHRGACIDYEKLMHHAENYPKLMDQAKEKLMSLPFVALYIEDRKTLWTRKKNGEYRPPDPKFVFNPNSADQKNEIMYQYYNFPTEYADESDASTEDNTVYTTGETSRHQMTLHCRDEKYEGLCTCRTYVPGWDTVYDLVQPDGTTIKLRDFKYHHPNNYKHYGIDPHKEGYEFLIQLRFWSKLRKLYNDYMLKIQRYTRPLAWQDKQGIPHNLRIIDFNYLLHWVKTGRLSTRDFPIHTMPWHADPRRLFVSRWKNTGGLMLSADYSQLEVRVVAAIGKDKEMLRLYREGADIHRHTAVQVYKTDQITTAMRRYCKTMTFRLIYGGGADAIAEETGLTRSEAQKMINEFLEYYTGIAGHINGCHSYVKEHGHIWTAFRRKFYLPDIFSEDRSKVAGALRDSQNYTVQSPGSDVTMTAVCIMRNRIKQHMMQSYVWAMVHDAIENDIYPGELLRYHRLLKAAMEDDVVKRFEDWLCVPMVSEYELGTRWDGSLVVKSIDKDGMILSGRKGFWEDTAEVMSRGYKFNHKILKEKLIGTHKDCGGTIESPSMKCLKCELVVPYPQGVDYGETLILRKSYEGENGGDVEVDVAIEWLQDLEAA